MSQKRLNELFILSIQNEILVELEYRNLISKLIYISNNIYIYIYIFFFLNEKSMSKVK